VGGFTRTTTRCPRSTSAWWRSMTAPARRNPAAMREPMTMDDYLRRGYPPCACWTWTCRWTAPARSSSPPSGRDMASQRCWSTGRWG
jgi:hypothetical protein